MDLSKHVRSGAHELFVPPKGQLPALDVLRTLAVMMVVVGHFGTDGYQDFPSLSSAFNGPLFRFGWTGVDLFFVLSGFLIGRQLWKELKATGAVNFRRFVLRRGFRIWPLYFVFVLLSPLISGRGHYRLADWLFFSNYSLGYVAGGWSLSTEEQFYLVAPLVLLLVGRKLAPRRWLYILPGVLVLVAAMRWATATAYFHEGMSVADVKNALYFPFHLRNEGLIVGLFLALVSVLRPGYVLRREGTPVRTVCIMALCSMAIGVALRTINNVIFPFLGLALVFGGLMVFLLMQTGWLKTLMTARPFYVVSRLSYGIYLNHLGVIFHIDPLVAAAVRRTGASPTATALVTFAVMLTVSFAIAAALYITIEQPFLKARDSILAIRGNTSGDPVSGEGGLRAAQA